jgi:Family of unknown function (DUF5331)
LIESSQNSDDLNLNFLLFMNIEHLRRALKSVWLTYYRQNRHWIIRLGVWVNCQGQRRPSASFILGVLSTQEPQLLQLLPLVVDLNSNPDRVVMALGLNFNPEEELKALEEDLESNQIPSQTHSPAVPRATVPRATVPEATASEATIPDAIVPDATIKMLPRSEAQPISTARDPQRIPLDTAQLSADELPDREVASRRRHRSRRKGHSGD